MPKVLKRKNRKRRNITTWNTVGPKYSGRKYPGFCGGTQEAKRRVRQGLADSYMSPLERLQNQ